MRALPEPRDSTAHYGQTDLAGLLKKPIPICGVMGELSGLPFRHRCFEIGMAKVTLGSGSSVSSTSAPPHVPAAMAPSPPSPGPTREYPPTASKASSTTPPRPSLAEDQLQLIKDASETESAATCVPDKRWRLPDPRFRGPQRPYWSPNSRAAIVGLTAHSNRNHVIRAALESIAYSSAMSWT